MKTILYNEEELKIQQKDIIRFYSKINIDYETGCWIWKCQQKDNGYGRFYFNGKYYTAHRFNYALTFGSIPKELFGCHMCDQKSCVNPYHIWMGTHEQNMKDMVNKKRSAILLGDKNGRAKLTQEKVDDMRKLNKKGMNYTQLADFFNLGKSQVSRICRGISWSE